MTEGAGEEAGVGSASETVVVAVEEPSSGASLTVGRDLLDGAGVLPVVSTTDVVRLRLEALCLVRLERSGIVFDGRESASYRRKGENKMVIQEDDALHCLRSLTPRLSPVNHYHCRIHHY